MLVADGQAGLWLTVVALGVYHGLNPAMGWPLAVAGGLTEKRGSAVFATLLPLGAGHLLAMSVALVPFAVLAWAFEWSRAIRVGAGALVLGFGLYKLMRPRHPRALARIRPTQLVWWSFLMATAHGAGLMLVPVALSLCTPDVGTALAESGHDRMMEMMRSSAGTAVAVSAVHTLAMMVAGAGVAWAVYRWLGLQFLRRAWFNLDRVWAASLMAAGAAGAGVAWWGETTD